MKDTERQIKEGKKIVLDYIKKVYPEFASRIQALTWGQIPDDSKRDEHRLALWVYEKRYTTGFTEEELIDLAAGDGQRALEKVEFWAQASGIGNRNRGAD